MKTGVQPVISTHRFDYFFFIISLKFLCFTSYFLSAYLFFHTGSVLPSIVETRDQNSLGCPLLFSNRNLGSFCA